METQRREKEMFHREKLNEVGGDRRDNDYRLGISILHEIVLIK